MKERPIPFSADMVRAILDWRKTQTRRVIKLAELQASSTSGCDWDYRDRRGLWHSVTTAELLLKCPYGVPGDRLWVREVWATVSSYDHLKPSLIPRGDLRWPQVWYAANTGAGGLYQTSCEFRGKVRPSMFMPRWASRITLEVVSIRVERVQDISFDDAIAEGVCEYPPDAHGMRSECRRWFQELWDSINAKRGYGWDVNPLVWVVEFKVVSNA